MHTTRLFTISCSIQGGLTPPPLDADSPDADPPDADPPWRQTPLIQIPLEADLCEQNDTQV